MKTLLTLTTLILALLNSQKTVAASPENDRPIDPPSILPVDSHCSLSAGGAVVDYGALSRWQLQDATGGVGSLTPGKRTLRVNVVCPYTQGMRLTLRGESASNGNLRYGDRGYMHIQLLDAQLDGETVQVATTTFDGVLSGSPASALTLQPGQTFAAITKGALAKGRSLTLSMEIEPILPEEETRVSSRRVSETQLTLELGK